MADNDLTINDVRRRTRPDNDDLGYSGHVTDLVWFPVKTHHRGVLARNHGDMLIAVAGQSQSIMTVPAGWLAYVEAVIFIINQDGQGGGWGTQTYSLGSNNPGFNNWNSGFQVNSVQQPLVVGQAKYIHATPYPTLGNPVVQVPVDGDVNGGEFRIRFVVPGSVGRMGFIVLGTAIKKPRVND